MPSTAEILANLFDVWQPAAEKTGEIADRSNLLGFLRRVQGQPYYRAPPKGSNDPGYHPSQEEIGKVLQNYLLISRLTLKRRMAHNPSTLTTSVGKMPART